MKCWACGSTNLKDRGGYWLCDDCGASTVPMPQTRELAFTTVTEREGKDRVTHNRPRKSRAKKESTN